MNSFLESYLPVAPTQPLLAPVKKKRGIWERLGDTLIQGDANWQPDDETKKQMVKKGLLEAGLSILANSSGYGNSPLSSISGGLLKGIDQINTESADLRGKTIGINGNRLTDYQRAVMAVQDPNTPPQVREAALVYLKLNPPAKAETFNTVLGPNGDLIQGSNKGGGNVYTPGSTEAIPFGNRQPQAPTVPQASGESAFIYPDNPQSSVQFNDKMGRELAAINATAQRYVAEGKATPEEAQAWSEQQIAMAKEAFGKEANPQPIPSRLVTDAKPLPMLGNQPTAQTLTEYDKKRANIVAKYGENAAVEWDATGKLPSSILPPQKTDAQIAADDSRARGKNEMSRVLGLLLSEYKDLDASKGITNTDRSAYENTSSYLRASDVGQGLGRFFGTKEQSSRDTISQLKPLILSAVIQASGMSAKQLDSNAEMKLWLAAVTDPKTSYQTVEKITNNLLMKFTGQGIEQLGKTNRPANEQPALSPDKNRESLLDRY